MSENDNQIEFVLDEPANVEKTSTEPVVEVVAEGEIQKK